MAQYYCERCPVNCHVATIYCIVESRHLCGLCGLNCLRQKHQVQEIGEQLVVHQGQEEGGPVPGDATTRMNRRLAAIRLGLKKTIRKTAPKMKVAAKLRDKYSKGRFARRDPKDDGASGAAGVN